MTHIQAHTTFLNLAPSLHAALVEHFGGSYAFSVCNSNIPFLFYST